MCLHRCGSPSGQMYCSRRVVSLVCLVVLKARSTLCVPDKMNLGPRSMSELLLSYFIRLSRDELHSGDELVEQHAIAERPAPTPQV